MLLFFPFVKFYKTFPTLFFVIIIYTSSITYAYKTKGQNNTTQKSSLYQSDFIEMKKQNSYKVESLPNLNRSDCCFLPGTLSTAEVEKPKVLSWHKVQRWCILSEFAFYVGLVDISFKFHREKKNSNWE